MGLQIEPLKPEDLEEFVKIYWAAFEPLEANMILPQIYKELSPELIDCLCGRIQTQTRGNLSEYCCCAKDTASSQIVGVAWWDTIHNPPRTKEEMDAKYEDARKARFAEPSIEGMNQELNRVYFKGKTYIEMETMKGRPYVTLRALAIHPNQQRRGIGSLLLKHVLNKAEQLELPVYLDCGVMGKPLYERYGFNVTSEIPLNCLNYGGRSDGRHWAMVRPAEILNGRV